MCFPKINTELQSVYDGHGANDDEDEQDINVELFVEIVRFQDFVADLIIDNSLVGRIIDQVWTSRKVANMWAIICDIVENATIGELQSILQNKGT